MKINICCKHLRSQFNKTLRAIHVCTVILMVINILGLHSSIYSQNSSVSKPLWDMGVTTGMNFNFYNGSVQQLNSEITTFSPFSNGGGMGFFFAAKAGYHISLSRWSYHLQMGYDSRSGAFKKVKQPCGCEDELSTNLGYIAVEPLIDYKPFNVPILFFAGPRMGLNIQKSFILRSELNPESTGDAIHFRELSKFSNINSVVFSLQFGISYDFSFDTRFDNNHVMLTPFISFQPQWWQDPRSFESWKLSTLRIGITISKIMKNSSAVLSKSATRPMFH